MNKFIQVILILCTAFYISCGNIYHDEVNDDTINSIIHDLKTITLSYGDLNPSFDPGVNNYTLDVEYNVSKIAITALADNSHTEVQINEYSPVKSECSQNIDLIVGENNVEIKLIHNDVIKNNYNIIINRKRENIKSVNLYRLIPSIGQLSPEFDQETNNYNLYLENSNELLDFIIETEYSEALATLIINEDNNNKIFTFEKLKLNCGINEFKINVTATNLNAEKNYIIKVFRKQNYNNNYSVENQTDLENLKSYTHINGSLIINEQNNITNLDYLKSIISVTNDLVITSNEKLENIDGLCNLTTIGGNLKINNNNVLESINDLIIYNSENDKGLKGLGIKNIQTIGKNIEIKNNPHLLNIFAEDFAQYIASSSSYNGTTTINNNKENTVNSSITFTTSGNNNFRLPAYLINIEATITLIGGGGIGGNGENTGWYSSHYGGSGAGGGGGEKIVVNNFELYPATDYLVYVGFTTISGTDVDHYTVTTKNDSYLRYNDLYPNNKLVSALGGKTGESGNKTINRIATGGTGYPYKGKDGEPSKVVTYSTNASGGYGGNGHTIDGITYGKGGRGGSGGVSFTTIFNDYQGALGKAGKSGAAKIEWSANHNIRRIK